MKKTLTAFLLLPAYVFTANVASARPASPDSTSILNQNYTIFPAKPLLAEKTDNVGSPLEYVLPKSPQAAALAKRILPGCQY